MYKAINEHSVLLKESGAVIPLPASESYGFAYEAWLAEGNTPEPADPQPDAKIAVWNNIKAERDRRTQTGGYLTAGKWFHSDTFSRTQIISMLVMGASLPAGIQWKTMDGTFIEMTPALAGQIFAAAATQDQATFTAAETHRLAMESAPVPAEYDFSTGWPEIYGG